MLALSSGRLLPRLHNRGMAQCVSLSLVLQVLLLCWFGVFQEGDLDPEPLESFYNLNETGAECPPSISDVQRSRGVCIVKCDPPESCAGNNFCGEGYVSKAPTYRCGSCAVRYYRRSGECMRCPDAAWLLIIIFIVVALSLAVVVFLLNKYRVNIAFLSIGIDYFQVLSIFKDSRVVWPEFVEEILTFALRLQFQP